MKRYFFNIQISGVGENENEAWDDAVELFGNDPGAPPDAEDIIYAPAIISEDSVPDEQALVLINDSFNEDDSMLGDELQSDDLI